MKYLYQDSIAAGLMHKKKLATNKNGCKKKDYSNISLNVQVSKRFHANPNHGFKTTMKPIFALKNKQRNIHHALHYY